MNGAETGSRRGEAGRAAAMNSAEQTVTWLITLGVLESPKKTISDPEGFLQASLKDGVVLCRLLERLLPGTIEKVSAPRPAPPRRTDRPRAVGVPGQWEPRRGEARDARRRAGAGSLAPAPGGRAGRASAGRGGAHAPPLCADPGTRAARGARWRRENPVAGARGAIVCGAGWGEGRGRGPGERPPGGSEERGALRSAPPEGGVAPLRDPSRKPCSSPARSCLRGLCLNGFCCWCWMRV